MKRIGIMGGTFNPVHIGHLLLAEHAKEELQLDAVWFIPTGCSYLKDEQLKPESGTPSPGERLQMVQLAIEDVSYFKCLDIEIRRAGYTYSYETMEELKTRYPSWEFFFIMGADCLYSIENWKSPDRLMQSCHIAAAVRDEASLSGMEEKRKQLQERFHADITLLRFRRLELSSTEIRERVRLGKSIRYMLPEKTAQYIYEKEFYRNEDS